MRVRMIELSQQMKYVDIEKIKEVLQGKECIKDYAYIIHDKDKDTEVHIHLMMRFTAPYDTKHIAQWFGVSEQYLCRIKGKFGDALLYLTHGNAPNKYQYSVDEVVSNFDFMSEKTSSGDSRREDIINKIVSGEIREYNYYDYISISEYDKYKKSIDNAFKYRVDKIKGVARSMDCVFITGESGSGKSTYAKMLAEEKGYSVFVSSGSNDPLDDYKGQDCIILDDLRPSCMGLSDLLKMLDNHTASTVKSRYKNKVLECKMIIITTILDIDTFFNNVFSEEKETAIQLKRRCKVKIEFDFKHMHTYYWNDDFREYRYLGKLPNPVALKYGIKSMSEDEQLEALSNVLSLSSDMVEMLKKERMNMKVVEDGTQLGW